MKEIKEMFGVLDNTNFKTLLKKLKVKSLTGGQKRYYLKSCDKILNNEIDDTQRLIDTLTWSKTSFKLSRLQRENLKLLRITVNRIKVVDCEHKNLRVIALLYGGGFTPTITLPELVCIDCELNITLFEKRINSMKDCLSIPSTLQKDIFEWASKTVRNVSSSELMHGFRHTYNEANKYPKSVKDIKILDKDKLELMDGE
jgi:hypothetical protein